MDGMTERANHSIGQLFRAAISPDQKDWVYKIPMMEFAINASISESTGFAQFELDGVYMLMMIHQLPESNTAPLGMRTFAQQGVVTTNLIITIRHCLDSNCVYCHGKYENTFH